ncbi:putative lipase atg15 [Serendipita sp. 399]|nr:putative lipase atg15 [Serendipita sp. 399]
MPPLAVLIRYFSLLWPFSLEPQDTPKSDSSPSHIVFRHQHAFIANPHLPQSFVASRKPPQILFNDRLLPPDPQTQSIRELDGDYTAAGLHPHQLRSRMTRVKRLRRQESLNEARKRSIYYSQSSILDWDEVEIPAPDVTDRLTVAELAKLTGNAYALPDQKGWYDVDGNWNKSTPFGWEVNDDGFRGNIFVSQDNTTVVLSIKGTSLVGQGPTATRDKLNDNRMFSCCCARISPAWRFSTDDDMYYNIGINLYNNLTYMYPEATIWIVGHSLGGGLSGLLGATFGAPTVTFEALGDRLAASRLHLPSPPPPPEVDAQHAFSLHPITHIYHTADPIPHGVCTGVRSLCTKAGFALEAHCHLGKTIVYDTISKYGWSLSVTHHPIAVMIGKVLADEWDEDGFAVPQAWPQLDCVDCHKWDFLNEEP